MNRAPTFLRRLLRVGVTTAAGLWLTLQLIGADSAASFDAANHALAAGRAEEAARLYDRLVQSGGTSAAIERNWALACQQMGLNAQALLHLRRAAHLAPRDADVLADLRALRTKLGAATGSESRDASWIRLLSVDTWGWAALTLMWLTGGVGMARTLRPALRDRLTGALVGGVAATAVASLLAGAAYLDFQSLPNAIVLQGDTILRQSPIDEARPAFTAPAAAELRVRDTRPGWVMGEDPASGRFGWVPQKQLGFVIP
jgi:tetratricopeptide (TPR) repeat protein